MKPKVSLTMNSEALSILFSTPPISPTMPRAWRRLARIRINLMREIKAINKELCRHRAKINVVLPKGEITL